MAGPPMCFEVRVVSYSDQMLTAVVVACVPYLEEDESRWGQTEGFTPDRST